MSQARFRFLSGFGRCADPAAGVNEQLEHLTDRPFLTDPSSQRQVVLDVVAVAVAVLVLDDIAGVREVRDDAKSGALGDSKGRADVAEAYAGVVGDAEEGTSMVGQKAPLRHDQENNFSRT
ncbi:MAG: hypothetical protein QOF83_4255 [Solirubrobacteraceae bacterium]|nr:hypothetical protein [Solirubrobacteraceae bacterium]